MKIVAKIALAGVLLPVALVLLVGLNVSYDFPNLSMLGSSGRTAIYLHDPPISSSPVFFVTRYDRADPSRFDIVHRGLQPPAALDHTVMTTEIRGGNRAASMTTLCRRAQEICQPVIMAWIGDGAVATVTVIDYDRSGAVIGRVTDRYELRRRWRVGPRFLDTMMSV